MTSPDASFDLLSRGAPGSLDETFGKNGIVEVATTSSTGFDAMALQADGKLLFAGDPLQGGSTNFLVGRLLADGTSDPTFGSNGTLLINFDGTTSASAHTLLVQTDGKIIVVGVTGSGGVTALMRLTRSGQLDTTFGGTGKIRLDKAGFGFVSSACLAGDGSVFVLASSNSDAEIAKVSPSGALDPGFGAGGFRLIPAATFSGGTRLSPYSIATSGGKVVASTQIVRTTGYDTSVGIATVTQTGNAALVAGDTPFQLVNTGTVPLVVRSDGSAVVAYNVNQNQMIESQGLGIYGFAPDGHSRDGVLDLPIYSSIDDHPNAMAQDDKERYVIAARGDGAAPPFRVLRRLPSGAPDPTFASSDGIASTPIGDTAQAMSIALQVDRRIIVGGERQVAESRALAFARYWP